MPSEVQTNVQERPRSVSQEFNVDARPQRSRRFWQVVRFSVVGSMNTVIDLLALNILLLLFPTSNSFVLLGLNAVAYSIGAINSFFLNKYWTFGSKHRLTHSELLRFTITTLCSIALSSSIIWLASDRLHPFLLNATLWANASKVFAVVCTSLISYIAMSLWVFVHKSR